MSRGFLRLLGYVLSIPPGFVRLPGCVFSIPPAVFDIAAGA